MVKIKFKDTFLGTHYWTDCPHEEVDFLKNEHHHDFVVTVQCTVNHEDRDLEWIMLRCELKKFMRDNYHSDYEIIRFEGRSCETIAAEICTYFKTKYAKHNWKVSVSEDNIYEGGEW